MKSLAACLLGLLMLVACGGDESPTSAGNRDNSTGDESPTSAGNRDNSTGDEKTFSLRDNSTGDEKTFSLSNGADMAFVWIEPGVFQMGLPARGAGYDNRASPVHEVEISEGFWLGKYEVTQEQWEAVMGTTPWSGGDYVVSDPSHPAVYISWIDVQAFIHRLNEAAGDSLYRLPSEAEWEYACRAGSTTRWSFGDDESQLTHYAWYRDNARDVGEWYAHAVGQKKPNAWGLYDMHGNAWEWVQDWSGDYNNSSPRVDPRGPSSGYYRVVRSGGFGVYAFQLQSAYRGGWIPNSRARGSVGVRLLRIP